MSEKKKKEKHPGFPPIFLYLPCHVYVSRDAHWKRMKKKIEFHVDSFK